MHKVIISCKIRHSMGKSHEICRLCIHWAAEEDLPSGLNRHDVYNPLMSDSDLSVIIGLCALDGKYSGAIEECHLVSDAGGTRFVSASGLVKNIAGF